MKRHQIVVMGIAVLLMALFAVGCGSAPPAPIVQEPTAELRSEPPIEVVLEAPTSEPLTPTPTPDFSIYTPELARVFEAHQALAFLDTFEAFTFETNISAVKPSEIAISNITVENVLTMTTYFIQDDPPNVLAEYELTTNEDKLYAETRFVDGALYVQGRREVTGNKGDDLDPMPEGWVPVESSEAWPALDDLPLETYFEDKVQFRLFDQDLDLWLIEPTETSTERGTADDGTPVDIVKIVWSDRALEPLIQSKWPDLIEDDHQVTEDSVTEIVAAIDDEGRLVEYLWSSHEGLVKNDAADKPITMFMHSSVRFVVIKKINASIEPVDAP